MQHGVTFISVERSRSLFPGRSLGGRRPCSIFYIEPSEARSALIELHFVINLLLLVDRYADACEMYKRQSKRYLKRRLHVRFVLV